MFIDHIDDVPEIQIERVQIPFDIGMPRPVLVSNELHGLIAGDHAFTDLVASEGIMFGEASDRMIDVIVESGCAVSNTPC